MTAKERVISELKAYLNSEKWQGLRNKNSKFTNWIEQLSEKDVVFGANPKFITAQVWGNSTAVGESSYGDTTTQRTIAMDHLSSNKCFVDISNKADKKTLKRGFANFGFTSEKFYYQTQASEIAKKDGKYKTESNLRSLNFTQKSHRLNSYDLRYTSDVISCSLWPIYAKQDEKDVFLGFWEEHNGKAEIDFEITPPMTPLKKLITFGVIGAVVLIGALILIL